MFKYITIIGVLLFFIGVITSCGETDGKAEASAAKISGEFLVVKAAGINGLDAALAAKGKQIYEQKCTACHKYDQRLVGPPLGDVAKKRSPEYIVSFITDPGQMIKNNETGKQLFREYLTEMTNQNISLDEAKAIYHHLLNVSSK